VSAVPSLPTTAKLVVEAAERMLALGVPIVSVCAWGGPTCERPKPFGPESPTSSHGVCPACLTLAFPSNRKV
jgi:hypothetical protein